MSLTESRLTRTSVSTGSSGRTTVTATSVASDGRSRAPLVAAKLLIELGCPLRDALNRVRSARPGVLSRKPEVEFLTAQTPGQAYVVPRAGAAPLPVPGADDGVPLTMVPNPDQLELLRAS